MLNGEHIATMLRAAGAGTTNKATSLQGIADLFNDAMIKYGDGQFNTTNRVAALISECMMESAWFNVTEEYSKNGRYAPYIGRTFIQVTWKDNYASFGKWCNSVGLIDDPAYFVDNPKKLADLQWAALGGVWYFTKVMFAGKPLTEYSDDILAVGRAVNLGSPTSKNTPNGQKARDAAYKAVKVLGDVIVPTISDPVPTPDPIPTSIPENPVKHSNTYDVDYVWYGKGNGHSGGWIPVNLVEVLDAAAKETGKPVRLSQGGLNGSVSASAKTHMGLGAFDIAIDGRSKTQVWALCSVLLRSGIVAFPRGYVADSFQNNKHIHAVSSDNYDNLHAQAKAQVNEYKKGGDGLVGSRKYTGPSTKLESWKTSPFNPDNVKKKSGTMVVQTKTLLGLDVDRNQKKTRAKGYEVDYTRQIKRWGRWNVVTEQNTYYAIEVDGEIFLKEKPKPVEPPVVVDPPVVVTPPVVVPEPVPTEPAIQELQRGYRDGTRGD